MSWSWGWRPYVSVAQRRAKAKQFAAKLAKKGRVLRPVQIAGREIAKTFWGRAWCENLESYSDFANRLPRGRTYVRNGSVIDLQIERAKVTAIVSGSEIYNVKVEIAPLANSLWTKIRRDCSRTIDSLIDLLQARLSTGVMERLTRQKDGLFPQPKEIKMRCSCPDWAGLCKHLAAVLYGVGARLDDDPELLFTLRDVDHLELISQAVAGENLDQALGVGQEHKLAGEDLSELFGIDLERSGTAAPPLDGSACVSQPTSRRRSPAGGPAAKTRAKPRTSEKRAKKKRPVSRKKVLAASQSATRRAGTKRASDTHKETVTSA